MAARGLYALVTAAVVGGCGRISFEPVGGPAPEDAGGDAAPADGPAADLLLHLPLDTDLRDLAAGRVVACEGACPQFGAGVRGGAAAFAGDACVRLDLPVAIAPPEVTLALWVRPTAGREDTLLSRPYAGATGPLNTWELFTFPNGDARFVTNEARGSTLMISPGFVTDGWRHLAAVHTGAERRLYIDGARVGAVEASALLYQDDPILVGCDQNMGDLGYRALAQLDDVRVYTRALSDAELAALATP